jgi:hypothetical protein
MSSLLSRQILSVNTATAAPIDIDGRRILSGIGKRAVSTLADPQRIKVQQLGLAGDEQADLTVHGGLAKAVYAYPAEHLPFWQTVRAQARVAAALGRPHAAGHAGREPDPDRGLDRRPAACVGDRLRLCRLRAGHQRAAQAVLQVRRHRWASNRPPS